MDDVTTLLNNLPQAVSDFEAEVKYTKVYMIFTAAALAYLILSDIRRR